MHTDITSGSGSQNVFALETAQNKLAYTSKHHELYINHALCNLSICACTLFPCVLSIYNLLQLDMNYSLTE
jgi:hypothetical protein